MPYTVPVSFDKFRENIEPPAYNREAATTRKDDLISILNKNFNILDSFPSGSLPRYTAVKDHADLDVVVVFHYGSHIKGKKPSQVLQAVRDCLADYKTNVRKNGQAVTLYYQTWPNVDVVPVSKVTNNDGSISHYEVPDMSTETWIQSQPVRHSNDLSDRNKSFGEEFKRIIKMIKWWNHQQSHLLQSYHIEVLALNSLVGSFTTYPSEIRYFFSKAVEQMQSQLWHNTSYVDAYLDYQARQEIIKRLTTAHEKAASAWYKTYDKNNDHKGAIEIWRQIFGEEFPAYG